MTWGLSSIGSLSAIPTKIGRAVVRENAMNVSHIAGLSVIEHLWRDRARGQLSQAASASTRIAATEIFLTSIFVRFRQFADSVFANRC
jgi:hypothetical protein